MADDRTNMKRRGFWTAFALASLLLGGVAAAQVERAEVEIDGLT